MPDIVIHPTRKWLKFQYTAVFILLCVCVFLWNNYDLSAWLLIVPGLLFLFPMTGSIRRRFTKMTISGDRLRYDTGMLSRSSRTIQLHKVQDVRIDQTLLQRLMSTGTLSFETAGETSRLVFPDVDEPQTVADAIIEAAHAAPPTPPQSPAKRKGERA
ncbi:MAG TPA: PH domain-containing protein [Bryobacteraceae bacterium]|nr:PH domain-containing protein [Bryobacteraceae bacterium]